MDSETVQLKRQLNAEKEKIKLLNTQMQRLASVTKKAHSQLKEETLVIELEDKICQLSRDNMKLKTKLANTRSLLSAKSPKQNNPMIPVTRRPPTIKKSVQDKPGSEIRHNELESQEVQRLNALVNMLRSKLLDLESEKSDIAKTLEQERASRADEVASILAKNDLDKIQLQKSLREFQNKYSSIQAHCNGLGRENSDLKVKLTALEAETEKLRSFYAAPENLNGSETDPKKSSDELYNLELINEDLKEQNKTISAENSRLLLLASKTASAESEGDSSDKYIRRIKDLEENLDEFRMREEMLLSQLEESKKYADNSSSNVYYDRLKQAKDDLQQKFALLAGDDVASTQEILEAISLLKVRKQNGFNSNLDFLASFDSQVEITKKMDLERQNHIETIQNLDKNYRLLKDQKKLNSSLQNEIDCLNKKIIQIQSEKDLKLEEQNCIIDLKQTRIDALKAKLEDILQGGLVYPLYSVPEMDADCGLATGQNVFEIGITSIRFSGDAILTSPSSTVDCIATFVSFDFFDFAPQVTNMAVGLSSVYRFSTRFKVQTDDYFIDYMLHRILVFEVWRNFGGELMKLGSSRIRLESIFHDALDDSSNGPTKYSTDVTDLNGRNIGQLSWTFYARLPLKKTITDSRDKTKSSMLISGSSPNSGGSSGNQAPLNKLIFCFDKFSTLNRDLIGYSCFYLGFSYYMIGSYVTDSFSLLNKGENSASKIEFRLDVELKIDVITSPEFEDMLKTEPVEVTLFADVPNTSDVMISQSRLVTDNSCLVAIGSTKICIMDLDKTRCIEGTWELKRPDGVSIGLLSGKISFAGPYRTSLPSFDWNKSIRHGTPLPLPDPESPAKSMRPSTASHENTIRDLVVGKIEVVKVSSYNNLPNEISGEIEKDPGLADLGTVSRENSTRHDLSAVNHSSTIPADEHMTDLPENADDRESRLPKEDNRILDSSNCNHIKESTQPVAGQLNDNLVLGVNDQIEHTAILPQIQNLSLLETKAQEIHDKAQKNTPLVTAVSLDYNSTAPIKIPPAERFLVSASDSTCGAEESHCMFSISIDYVNFSTASADVCFYLSETLGIDYFFVTYNFLSYSPEGLESASFEFVFKENISIDFKKEFKFESLKNGNELTNFLRSEKSISFILVSEPLPSSSGSGLSHCVDFALASVDLLEILEQTPNHLDSVQLLLDIHMNRNDPIANLPFENEAVLRPIGVLALTLRGLNFLHEVMDLSNSKIKANKLSQSDAAMDILLRVREDYTRKKQQSLSAYSLPSKPSLPISASFAKLLPGRKSQNVADASNSSLNSPKLRQDNSDIVSIDDLAERLFDG